MDKIRTSVNSENSENLINCSSMNWGQLKGPLCYLCLTGAVVASWFLTQGEEGWNSLLKYNIFVSKL